jgi:hypothetical protein
MPTQIAQAWTKCDVFRLIPPVGSDFLRVDITFFDVQIRRSDGMKRAERLLA